MLDTLLNLSAALPASVHADNSWINFDVNSLVQNFWPATFDGLTFGAVYALVALGYTLVYGVLNLINFAHSEVFIMGCYGVVATLTTLGFGPNPPNLSIWAIIANLLLAMIVGMVFSVVTAFETQAIKSMYIDNASYGGEAQLKRSSIFGAFMLYGSFITLFIHILNILGMLNSNSN